MTKRERIVEIRFHCPTEDCVAIIEYAPLEGAGHTIECPRCHARHRIEMGDGQRQPHELSHCVVCGCKEMFVRKDFPQRLGLFIVAAAGLVSFATLESHPSIAYGVLLLAVLIDVVLYALTGRVTSCYACRAEYRGAGLNPAHQGFDLATSEKY